MLIKCTNCGYEFHGQNYRDDSGKNTVCEKCGCSFDVTQNELEFTLVNCDGKDIRKEYGLAEDFVNEMNSDSNDIPMRDDRITSLTLFGVEFTNEWDVSALLDYLTR